MHLKCSLNGGAGVEQAFFFSVMEWVSYVFFFYKSLGMNGKLNGSSFVPDFWNCFRDFFREFRPTAATADDDDDDAAAGGDR